MSANCDVVILTSTYSRAARKLGFFFMAIVIIVGSFLLYNGEYSIAGVVTIIGFLLLFTKLALSSGGVQFSKDNVEISRNILWHNYYIAFPINTFTKVKIVQRYAHTMGEVGTSLYYLILIDEKKCSENLPMQETTGTDKAEKVYINAQKIVAVTGYNLEVEKSIANDFSL